MASAEFLESIRSEGERILELARQDRDPPIPQYPGWVMGDLLSHLGSIHARTTLLCREQPSERPSAPRRPEGTDPVDWCEANLREMLATLEESEPDTPVWGFWPDSCIEYWERRMVVETGVHRWDVEQAFGDPQPLSPLVAGVGLDEFGGLWLRRIGEMPALEVHASDLGRTWSYGEGDSTSTVSGTGSDLLLRLMSRPSPVELPDDWAAAVDSLEPPPKP